MSSTNTKWYQNGYVYLTVGIIIGSCILAFGLGSIKGNDDSITVKGYAEMNLTSDLCVWRISINARMSTLASTFDKIKQNKERIYAFLLDNGIDKSIIKETSLSNYTIYNYDRNGGESDVKGYSMSQSLVINSKDIKQIQSLSLSINDLLAEGIEFNSNPPEFYVSDLGKYKIKMLGEALKDAKIRATEIAKSVGNDIGGIRYARQGIFQITPVNSTEISDWGINDVSSVEKSIKSVVDASFYVK
ncbi:MAG: hypothetical protein A2X64_09305 [Ignavibacteria bacterium GWF2_33_9]|nr:MAG: hypothetical protein A2X64_09305 [Ignavibacteria bacterium GWF2_33_9]